MQALVEKFNAENPDIRVIYEMYTENYPQTLEISYTTGNMPDIVGVVPNVLYPREALLPLDQFLTDTDKARFEGMFIEGINKVKGNIVSLPNTGITRRLVYNKDIFARVGIAEPPKTLDELVANAKLITEKLKGEGIYGFGLPMKSPASGLARGLTIIPPLSGQPFHEGVDMKTGKYDWSYMKPVVAALTEIWASGSAFPGCESLDMDPMRTQFANGKIGMYMTYNHSEWGVYTKQFPTEQDWAYAMMPTLDGTVKGTQWMDAGYWYGITKQSEHPEEAWRVLQEFYKAENLADYYEAGLGLVVVPDALALAETPESIKYTPFMGTQETDKIWPPIPIGVVPEGDDWFTSFASIILGGRPVTDLDSVIADLNARYNAAYDKTLADGINAARLEFPDFDVKNPAASLG
jgi:multiple sugar transport system substrate-binding protein